MSERYILGGHGDHVLVARLSREECLACLAQAPLGRVAMTVGALPAVRTVRFALAEEHVVFRVASESRFRRAVANTVVVFQVDHFDEQARQGWCVEVHGIGHEVTDPDVASRLGRLPLEALGDDPTRDLFVRIPITSVSGQRVRWPLGAGG